MDSAPTRASVAVYLLRWCATQERLSKKQRTDLIRRGKPYLPWLKTRKIDSLFYLATESPSSAQSAYDKIFLVQHNALLELLGEFESSDCRVIVFKGAEHIAARYGKRALGCLCDIDILVMRPMLEAAKAILYRLGYRQAYFDMANATLADLDVRDIAQIESEHYQLAPFAKLVDIQLDEQEWALLPATPGSAVRRVGDQLKVQLEVDLHFQISSDHMPQALWDRAVPSTMGIGETFSDTDHLWFTLSRHYSEVALHGKYSLREFAYVLPVLYQSPIDWEVVLTANNEMGLSPGLYYYLSFFDYVYQSVPASVLSELHPLKCTRMCDFGWQLGRMFDIVDAFDFPALE